MLTMNMNNVDQSTGHYLCTVPRMRRSPTHEAGITSVCAIANCTLLFVMAISVLRVNNESFLFGNEKDASHVETCFCLHAPPLSHGLLAFLQ